MAHVGTVRLRYTPAANGMSAGVGIFGGVAENGTKTARPARCPCRALYDRRETITARRIFRISGGTHAMS